MTRREVDLLADAFLLVVIASVLLSLVVALATLPHVHQDWGWFWLQTVVPGFAPASILQVAFDRQTWLSHPSMNNFVAGYSLVIYLALLVGLCIKGLNWYHDRRPTVAAAMSEEPAARPDETEPIEPAGTIVAIEETGHVAAPRYFGEYGRMRFQQRIHEEVSLTAAMLLEIAADEGLMGEIATVAEQFIACMRSGGKVLWCGNGGSAADAQHLAAEFVVRFTVGRPALPSLALTVDTSVLTACANDFGYEQVFARQVEALGRTGDVLVGISTSGNSPTVLCALETARKAGMVTIGFTGATGGKMAGLCETLLRVPSERTQNIQEAHILFGHIIVGLMEETLYPEKFAAGHK
jgi:D-sedoheptulose 7-phosphate isomerase